MDIRENIREGKYENTRSWPSSSDHSPEAYEARQRYHKMENVVTAAFMQDLAEYVTLQGAPHQYSKKLCEKAWEEGHANGLDEVVTCAEHIVEIFQ